MNEHEYLIEQLQYKGMEDTQSLENANEIGNFLKLRYNHPVKEIIWCLQDPISKCPQKSNGIYDMSKNAWFNFGYNKDDIVRFLGDNANSITIDITLIFSPKIVSFIIYIHKIINLLSNIHYIFYMTGGAFG